MSTPINFSTSTPTHSRQASHSGPLLVLPKKALSLTSIHVNATTSENSHFDANALCTSDSQKNTPSKMLKSVNSAFSQLSSPDTRQGSQEFYLSVSSDAAISAPRLPFSNTAAFASLFSQQKEQSSNHLPNNSEQKKTFSLGFLELLDSLFSQNTQTTTAASLSKLLNPLNSDSIFLDGWTLEDFDEKSKLSDTNFNVDKLRQTLNENCELARYIEFPVQDQYPRLDLHDDKLSTSDNTISSVLASAVNQVDDDFENSLDLTPWAQYSPKSQRGFITPSKGNRDRDSAALSTPPIASAKNQRNSLSPSKSKEPSPIRGSFAASSCDLPFVDSTNRERWYRQPTLLFPGIIIDSHQSKHTPGLCGIYTGGKGDQFQPQDCCPTRQREILDELMNHEECNHFQTRPKNTCPKEISVPWNGTYIRFSGQVYNSEDDCWYIHYFPVNKTRN